MIISSKKISFLLTIFATVFTLTLAPSDAFARKNEHGAQGTGNYKGKRDKHEKPGPNNEKKKKNSKWIKLKK